MTKKANRKVKDSPIQSTNSLPVEEQQPPVITNSEPIRLPIRTALNPTAPVWSVQETQSETVVPLAVKCDVHNIERTICCRELKGDDERSLIDPAVVKDIIIGLADGLCVPFALTAGLASLESSRIVCLAGVAEIISGSISMGVGGYLSAQAERDHYRFLKLKTRERVLRSCAGEMEREVAAVLGPLGIDESLSRRVAGSLLSIESTLSAPKTPQSIINSLLHKFSRSPKFSSEDERSHLLPHHTHSYSAQELEEEDEKGLTSFLLKFGEGLEEVSDSRIWISALTIGMAYFLGGLVPLIPYFLFDSARTALYWSIGVTCIVLIVFGGFKQYYSGAEVGVKGYTYGCASMLFTGGAAAASSFGIVKALEGGGL